MTNPSDAVTVTEGNYKADESKRGLTKREYFAGLAMQGLLANPDKDANWAGYAADAVRFADALIAALNENQS